MVRTLQLVSRSKIMKGDRDLGVGVEMAGGAGRQASATLEVIQIMGKLTTDPD